RGHAPSDARRDRDGRGDRAAPDARLIPSNGIDRAGCAGPVRTDGTPVLRRLGVPKVRSKPRRRIRMRIRNSCLVAGLAAVTALVGSFSFFDCASNSGYYESQNVLSITSVGATRECFHSRNIAPINQGPRLSGLGAAQYAVSQGAKSLSCVGNVLPNFGKWACDGLVAWGKQHNVKIQTFLGKPDAS